MIRKPSGGYARKVGQAGLLTGHALHAGCADGFPVIVHADDFGETGGITAGIRQAIEAGVVTSTSVMANMPGTQFALACAPSLADRASFGVHLNLCEGKPLTSARSLVDEQGCFHGKRALFLRSLLGRVQLQDVEAEVQAQIARVHDAGIAISHLDGHKHLHQLPVVMTAVANVLPKFGIQRVRITRLGSVTRTRSPAALVRELLAIRSSRAFRSANLRSPVRIVDLRGVIEADAATGGSSDRTRMVDNLGPVEWCCHPATRAADADKPGSHRRSVELDYLLSPRFRELTHLHSARLVTYWDV